MQLAEAMAIGVAPASQSDAYGNHENAEKRQGRAGSKPRQRDRNQRYGNGDFRQRKQQTQGSRESCRQSEIDQRFARAFAVGEFRDAREKEYGREEKSREQQSQFHNLEASARRR